MFFTFAGTRNAERGAGFDQINFQFAVPGTVHQKIAHVGNQANACGKVDDEEPQKNKGLGMTGVKKIGRQKILIY